MTVQGASGRTWLLRALLAVGGGLLAALVSVLLSAAPAHASPSAESDLPTVLAPVTDATGVLSDAVVTPSRGRTRGGRSGCGGRAGVRRRDTCG